MGTHGEQEEEGIILQTSCSLSEGKPMGTEDLGHSNPEDGQPKALFVFPVHRLKQSCQGGSLKSGLWLC